MYINLYRDESATPKYDAQVNLAGRTHYVDDDTLRYFRSRILSSHVIAGGLLFAIVESASIDPDHKTRGFRHVVWDVFGTVVDRPGISEMHKTRKAATKAMWKVLNSLDVAALTTKAIADQRARYAAECDKLDADVARLVADGKVATPA